MKQKISKVTPFIIMLMMLGMQNITWAQGLTAEQEKALDKKMQVLEQKVKELQGKIDDLQLSEKKATVVRIPKPPRIANPPAKPESDYAYSFKGLGDGFSQAFSGLNKTLNMNLNFNDKELEEKIKSGQIKELTKTYSKTYSVGKEDKVVIDNRFGSVIVNTWTKNEVKVDIQIKVAAYDEANSQHMLDGVTIADSKEGSVISFKTVINGNHDNNNSFWLGGGNTKSQKLEINYLVYMPTRNALDITNRFGSTQLPDFEGKLTINSSFGSFTGKSLTNPANDISSRYGSATIDNLSSASLKVAYGNIDLGTGDNLNADISYSQAKIGKLKTAGDFNVKYGGLKIAAIDRNVKNISVNSSYSPVTLAVSDDPNFDFDITVSYGSFNYGDHSVSLISQTPADDERGWHPTKTYKGRIGKGNNEKLITIKSKFGSVKFD